MKEIHLPTHLGGPSDASAASPLPWPHSLSGHFPSVLPHIPVPGKACVPCRWGYLQLLLFLQGNGIDDDELDADEAEHEQKRELVLKDQQEHVLDVGSVREPLHEHGEVLKQLGRCIVGVVLHDGLVQRVLEGQEAFLAVSCMRTQQTPGVRDPGRLTRQNT